MQPLVRGRAGRGERPIFALTGARYVDRAMSDVEVLYIIGTGRSGSTLLANMLGSTEGMFSAGELRFIWDRGFAEDRRCGCSLRFAACPTWSGIVDRAFGDEPPDLAQDAPRGRPGEPRSPAAAAADRAPRRGRGAGCGRLLPRTGRAPLPRGRGRVGRHGGRLLEAAHLLPPPPPDPVAAAPRRPPRPRPSSHGPLMEAAASHRRRRRRRGGDGPLQRLEVGRPLGHLELDRPAPVRPALATTSRCATKTW